VTDIPSNHDFPPPSRALSAYLFGALDFDAFISLQRRLVYDVGGDRTTGAVILCEHPPCVTIGREGSRAHIRPNFDLLTACLRTHERAESETSDSPVQWVSRGGGTMLHLPGQVACYPIVPLDLLGLTAARYLEELQNIALDLLRKFDLFGTIDQDRPGIRVNGRRVVHFGVAIRERITCFGFVVNVNPNLGPFHEVNCDGDPVPMTSIQRESPARVRVSGIRQWLLELIAARFGFDRVSIFHNHPSLLHRSSRYVAAPRS
jgi:lipoyl(octanoyl) transferase